MLLVQYVNSLYDMAQPYCIVPVVHWLVDQTESFRKLVVLTGDALGMQTLYKVGSTRPILTRTF